MGKKEQVEQLTTYMANFVSYIGKVLPDDIKAKINELAENLFNEGDTESIRIMAEENGIPEDYVELYINGDIPYLCDAQTAAMGKLDVESEKLKMKGLMLDWVEYIRGACMEDDLIAHQVRKKGKSLKGCMAALLTYSFENRISVDKELSLIHI